MSQTPKSADYTYMKPSKIRITQVQIVAKKMLVEALNQDYLHAYGKFTDYSNALKLIPDSDEDVLLNNTIMQYDHYRKEVAGILNAEISNLNSTLPKEVQFKDL